jgi:ribosomal protein S20
MRKAIKQARAAIENNDEDVAARVQHAVDVVQRARSRNIIHAATASRTVSRLVKAGNAAQASA